ncbi:hypothetical protein [Vulcanisaeta souniana]|uniref:Uncharacterized protein n=1 Tax=Vulcanisaeta souniana JCM 11219 TaxID=1293586 RepID=A0A830E8M8_9CREN|nr:hypothetical protein [Vulcanisaeta souniana]BDR91037.1 hypothetical protein Vsou_01300 [Vulcanisaeta souniana JCM 11219]GGI80316.1 hypothetical protein GCM10007112_16450 [Vulcanisaeta souniana JCM 11219]
MEDFAIGAYTAVRVISKELKEAIEKRDLDRIKRYVEVIDSWNKSLNQQEK